MVGRCMVFRVSFLPFWLEATVKNNTWNERDFRHGYGNYFKSVVLNVTWFQLRSKLFLNYEAHWQWHLEVTLQLKNLGTWPNKHANSFMGKYHEIKIGEKVLFLMLLDFSYVQSSSSITRHIDNDIWKLLYSWRI